MDNLIEKKECKIIKLVYSDNQTLVRILDIFKLLGFKGERDSKGIVTITETEQVLKAVRKSLFKKETKEEKENIENSFNLFWKAYPKRVGKVKCYNWFISKKVTNELLSTMIQAIEKQKQSIQWTSNGGQFIPNPLTWLNRGGWEDELNYDNSLNINVEKTSYQSTNENQEEEKEEENIDFKDIMGGLL